MRWEYSLVSKNSSIFADRARLPTTEVISTLIAKVFLFHIVSRIGQIVSHVSNWWLLLGRARDLLRVNEFWKNQTFCRAPRPENNHPEWKVLIAICAQDNLPRNHLFLWTHRLNFFKTKALKHHDEQMNFTLTFFELKVSSGILTWI